MKSTDLDRRGFRAYTLADLRGVADWFTGRLNDFEKIMRVPFSFMAGLLGLGVALLSVSCAPSGGSAPPRRAERVLYRWYDDGGPGKVTIRISLPDQVAEFQRDGRDIGWCYVATGKEGHGTSPGDYKITEKIVDKYSNRYGWIEDEFGNVVNPDAKHTDRVPEGMVYVPAPMPYWMRLTSYGIGMHGGFIPEPGKPASHGCIRLPKQFVPVLYDAVEVGTPVTITQARSQRVLEGDILPEEQVVPQFAGQSRVIATRPLTPLEARQAAGRTQRRIVEPYAGY
jgi:hypothetical protein